MPWLDLLGWGGSALLVFSLLQSRVLRFRVLNTLACVILTVFNGLIEVWPMVGMNLVLTAINLFFIVRLLRERHDDAVFGVIEVGPDDAYLRHVLATHAADIARFQPDLAWDPLAPAAGRSSSSRATRPSASSCSRSRAPTHWCGSTSSPRATATSPPASSCGAAATPSASSGSAGSSPRPAWSAPTTTGSGSAPTAAPTCWSSEGLKSGPGPADNPSAPVDHG